MIKDRHICSSLNFQQNTRKLNLAAKTTVAFLLQNLRYITEKK